MFPVSGISSNEEGSEEGSDEDRDEDKRTMVLVPILNSESYRKALKELEKRTQILIVIGIQIE